MVFTSARRLLRIGLIVGVVALMGCGGGGSTSFNAGYFEREMPRAIARDQQGSTLRDVTCVRETSNRFDCVGDYRPSRAEVEQQVSGIDTSNFTARDWQALISGRSGRISLTITVDQNRGSYIYRQDS